MKKLRYFIGTIFILCMITCFPSMAATTVRLPLIVEEDYTRAQELLVLINNRRHELDVMNDLKMDSQLQEIAMQRGAELAVLFDHDRPDDSGTVNLKDPYKKIVGENILRGAGTAQSAFDGWRSSGMHAATMQSETSNLTTSGYAHIRSQKARLYAASGAA